MRGSGVNWPADVAPDATHRAEGSRLLLDELLAERERAQTPVPPTPPPVLNVDPVAVPPSLDNSRRAVRQRLAELENAAMRNYHSAEEARRVLADEHHRLEQELSARTHAQHEAATLRRELERLNNEENRRAAQEKSKAERAARALIAEELKRYQDEHERVLNEMAVLRSSLTEHDGLLDEYVTRLRDEQGARAALRAELERAEAARSLAERSLQRANENARHGAEDEMIRLATFEQQIADAQSDRDRLVSRLADLTSGDGPVAKMTAQIEEKDAEIAQLGVRIADLGARIDASESAATEAITERDAAFAARNAAEAMLAEAEKARADAELAADVAAGRIAELEAELSEHTETTDERSRELDRTLGKLRREARDASNARRAAEEELATAEAERGDLRARVADLDAEVVRARADGDRLRAHAAMLGDELAAARATVTELQAAAPAHPLQERAAAPAPAEPRREDSSEESSERGREELAAATDAAPEAVDHPPLPLRIAGRHAPAQQVVRRRPKRDPALSASAVPTPRAKTAANAIAPAWVAAIEVETPAAKNPAEKAPAAKRTADAAAAAAAEEPLEAAPVPADTAPRPAVADDTVRRTALAEFTALASSGGDDFSFRRR